MRASHWCLCLHLLLLAWSFLLYCPSPTVRANIKKCQVGSMSFTRKIIWSALANLHNDEMTTHDEWSAVGAIYELITCSLFVN
jgi:hypothetical protein